MISGLKGRRARPLHQRGGSDRELRSAQPIKDNIGVFLDWDSWDLVLVGGVRLAPPFRPVTLTVALSRCCWVFGGEGTCP